MPKIVDHDQQRRELSSTVASVLAELGLENTTLRAVASRHGCTKGMVQHYFADKEELLLAALVFVENQCEARVARRSADNSGLKRLYCGLEAQLPTRPQLVNEWKVRFSFGIRSSLSREMRENLAHYHAIHNKNGMKSLRQAQKAGELKVGLNMRNSYRALDALVSGLSLSVLAGKGGPSPSIQRQILKTAIENLRR